MVVCICIVIFHGIHSLYPQKVFCGGLIFFFRILRFGPGNIWGPSVLGVLVSFLGEGARPFCSIKPSMNNHVNTRTVDSKIICVMSCVHVNFSHFYFGIFSWKIFCLFKCQLKLPKKCLLLLGIINSVKVWIMFDMSLNKPILFGSNSLKVRYYVIQTLKKDFTIG